jgi:thiamine biosynthesis lipoprotein
LLMFIVMTRYLHKAMDTEFAITVNGAEESIAASAAQACFDRIDALELILSKFHDTSDVAVIRGLSPGEVAVVSRETIDILVTCAQVCAATAGAFDPTTDRRNFSDLVIDTGHCRVSVKGEVSLDFGGIGKGFALDECRRILESEQFDLHDWLLDAGTSTVLVSGGPWPLGVGGPFKGRTRIQVVERLEEGALSGSGTEIQGAHIWDVRRGSKDTRWKQSWAIAPSGAIADALTTAALSLSSRELQSAADALNARILVARHQSKWMDRFRDPLTWYSAREAPRF